MFFRRLFAIYVNDVLIKLNSSKLRYHIKKICFNAFMYADDLILLSPTVTDLQKLVNICVDEFTLLDLSLNVSKSSCLRIGPRFNVRCASISAGSNTISWCSNIRYLGVFISCGRVFRCNLDNCRSNFYRSFNGIGCFKSSLTVFEIILLKNGSTFFNQIWRVCRRDLRNILTKISMTSRCDVMSNNQTRARW